MSTQLVDPQLRKTGIGVVGDVPWGTHLFMFRETKEGLLDTLVPYFKAGLESGGFMADTCPSPRVPRLFEFILPVTINE